MSHQPKTISLLCYQWTRFGDCDTTASMSFYVAWMNISDVFLVADIFGVFCSDIEWCDGRRKPMWSEYRQLCHEAETEFKKCYCDNICDLRDHVYDRAKRVFLGVESCLKTGGENLNIAAKSDGQSSVATVMQ